MVEQKKKTPRHGPLMCTETVGQSSTPNHSNCGDGRSGFFDQRMSRSGVAPSLACGAHDSFVASRVLDDWQPLLLESSHVPREHLAQTYPLLHLDHEVHVVHHHVQDLVAEVRREICTEPRFTDAQQSASNLRRLDPLLRATQPPSNCAHKQILHSRVQAADVTVDGGVDPVERRMLVLLLLLLSMVML